MDPVVFDFSTITSGIELDTVKTGILAMASMGASVTVVILGARKILQFLRGI